MEMVCCHDQIEKLRSKLMIENKASYKEAGDVGRAKCSTCFFKFRDAMCTYLGTSNTAPKSMCKIEQELDKS